MHPTIEGTQIHGQWTLTITVTNHQSLLNIYSSCLDKALPAMTVPFSYIQHQEVLSNLVCQSMTQ
jgi:hypothetical protein